MLLFLIIFYNYYYLLNHSFLKILNNLNYLFINPNLLLIFLIFLILLYKLSLILLLIHYLKNHLLFHFHLFFIMDNRIKYIINMSCAYFGIDNEIGNKINENEIV